MNNNRLLILMLFVSFGSANDSLAVEGPSDRTSSPIRSYVEGMKVWKGQLCKPRVLTNCENDCTKSCEIVAIKIFKASERRKLAYKIKEEEKALSEAQDVNAQDALAQRITQLKESCPDYDKDFRSTLSSEQKEELDNAISVLLKDVPAGAVDSEAYTINSLLR